MHAPKSFFRQFVPSVVVVFILQIYGMGKFSIDDCGRYFVGSGGGKGGFMRRQSGLYQRKLPYACPFVRVHCVRACVPPRGAVVCPGQTCR